MKDNKVFNLIWIFGAIVIGIFSIMIFEPRSEHRADMLENRKEYAEMTRRIFAEHEKLEDQKLDALAGRLALQVVNEVEKRWKPGGMSSAQRTLKDG